MLDTDFNPFNENMIASCSDDARIGIWEIPEDYSLRNYIDDDGNPRDIYPKKFLSGHRKKVGHILFHPTANNILASSSFDFSVKIWNIETGTDIFTLNHPNMVTSMSFSYNGDYLCTVSRDKNIRVWDIRNEKIISEGMGHSGTKNQRVVWLGNTNRIATTGFSKLSDRQIGIWDPFNLEQGNIGGFYTVDQSSGVLMPFYDDSNKILYLAGKGDGNIRYYEFQKDELFELSEFQSVDPQRGFAITPKRFVNVRENEVMKAFKTVRDQCIEPISFYVPRKSDVFQDDIYPDAASGKPSLTSEEWISGASVKGPILLSLKTLYNVSNLNSSKDENSYDKQINQGQLEPEYKEKQNDNQYTEQTDRNIHGIQFSTVNSVKSLQHDDSVNKLLQKASFLDEVNDIEESNNDLPEWDSEINDSKSISKVSQKVTIEKSNSDIPEWDSEINDFKSISKVSQKVTIENNISEKQDPGISSKNTHEKTSNHNSSIYTSLNVADTPLPACTKSLNLKQSVETLSDLVLKLESIVTKMKESSLEKDERLLQLEKKIEQLLKK